MSLRRSFLSRKTTHHRSLTFSKSKSEYALSQIQTEEQDELKTEHNDFVYDETGFSDSGSCSWSGMLPELLADIIQRVEASEGKWPERQSVVACGGVCKRWREITKDVVERESLNHGGKITFPSSLKKPGQQDLPLQCLIKRDKKNATFYLHLSISPSSAQCGKFLLAARRHRNGGHIEYIISLDADNVSQGSNSYIGKLRSDLLGTNFTIYDSQPPHDGAKPSSNRAGQRVANKQISPQVPAGNFEVGQVSYKFNLLRSRGPRRMVCSINCLCSEETSIKESQDNSEKQGETPAYTVLKNKAPRWHNHLECWCLNFHGRVTVASVKNFQLVATVNQALPGGKGDEETVLLQFGKVGDDTFTMDYRHPLSAFQAFTICLTSFGTKLACE